MKQKPPGRKPLTKKARKEQVQIIIDRNPIGLPFDAEDLALFNQLVSREFVSVKHMDNPSYPTDPRHVHVEDDVGWIPFSWNKAISPPADQERADQLAAMRDAIQPGMAEFLAEYGDCCVACGSVENTTCDHRSPPFIQLAEGFMERHSMEVELLDDGGPPQIVHDYVEKDWVYYHDSRVWYQALCRSCNASKGAR